MKALRSKETFPFQATVQGNLHRHKTRSNMSADPMVSEGARLERKAVRLRLRRMAKGYEANGDLRSKQAIDTELQWMLARHMRYEKMAGGLGNK